ncbi:ribonuclease HII [archaeon]|nr:ribonuclease HII [archaeon]|tara:strand:+ start:1276 stop:1935 length:660 start_codon:yes stop_codon:yes gene_type:complete
MVTTILGADEAGKGPTIGPLVMAGVIIPEDKEHKFSDAGITDSKQLSPQRREALVSTIKNLATKTKVIVILPQEIDEHVLSDDSNLNHLEAIKIAKLINELNPTKAFIDSPSPNLAAYKQSLQELITTKTELVCAHKADEKYPVVGAASILAKVKRDEEIEKIKQKIGKDFGSGYPADPRTVAFLKKYYNTYPDIFRKSWSSYQKVLAAKKQYKLNQYL